MFSDLALNLSIEIENGKIKKLHHALSKKSGKITPLNSNIMASPPKKEQLILLNISFMAASGNLKIKAPDVPG